MDIIKAPWTEEQVDTLNGYQKSGIFHPYTCGKNSTTLVATTDGWTCGCCDYTQDWVHKFSTEPQLEFPFPFLQNTQISYSGGTTSGFTGNCPDCGKPYIYAGDYFGDLGNYICTCRSKVSPYTNAQGWQCPRCFSVYAPWVSQCHKCSAFGGTRYTVTCGNDTNE